MNNRRLTWLLSGLVTLLLIRWLDPWPVASREAADDVVQAIVRAPASPASGPQAETPASAQPGESPTPTMDRLATSSPVRDLFITRAAVNSEAQQAQMLAAQKAQRKQPPPPPPPAPAPPVEPPEASPPLQVLGTWGGDDAPAVFLSTPNGTVMAHEASIILSQYKVQRIEPRQISLQNTQTQKVWTLPIPDAPSATSARPSRSSP